MDISFYMKLLKTLGAWYQQFVEKKPDGICTQ
jgi:hypothetical protein